MTPAHRPRVIVTPQARQALGQEGLTRTVLVKALTALHESLPRLASQSRQDRVPGNQGCFIFSYILLDEGQPLTLFFIIDDADWPTRVHVVDAYAVRPSQG